MASPENSPAQKILDTRGPALLASIDKTRDATRTSLGDSNLKTLKAVAAPLGIPTSGTKDDLLDRIAAHTANRCAAAETLSSLKADVTDESMALGALYTLVREAAAELAELDTRRARNQGLDLMARLTAENEWLSREATRANATLDSGRRAAELLTDYASAPEGTDFRALATEAATAALKENLAPQLNDDDGARAARAAQTQGARVFLRALWRVLPEWLAQIVSH